MSKTITVEVSDGDVALEVAYGVLGRAQQLYESAESESEEMALELRDVGQELAAEFGNK